MIKGKLGKNAKSVTITSIRKATSAADAHKEQHGKFGDESFYTVPENDEPEPEYSLSPKKFDDFIPWVCKQWDSTSAVNVVIIRKAQDQYVNIGEKRTLKFTKSKPKLEVSIDDIDESLDSFIKYCEKDDSSEVPLPVTAYYDVNNRLVEISIVGSPVRVPRKLFHAFSLAVPYHSSLTRFTFRRSHLTAELVYELNKLLSISNISDIIFDDSYVPEGNYYILLEQSSQLKYLSLNRCKINDEVCKKIFETIRFGAPAGNTLKILELGSNDITDDGAKFIGSVLRANRCLLHLNLSGNKITDGGFLRILDSLMEFPLDFEEKCAAKRSKFRYLQSKAAVYARCLNDIKSGIFVDTVSSGTTCDKKLLEKHLRLKKPTSKKSGPLRTNEDEAEMMAREIVGDFCHPFSPIDLELKNDVSYCKGNFVLCSINVAYNHLEYASVQKLSEVLQYQNGIIHMNSKYTGLIRITLDGNRIPKTCSELDDVELYLKKVVHFSTVAESKKRHKSFLHKSKFQPTHNSLSMIM